MKLSNYNFFFPFPEDGSKHIAFNGFKTSLALIDNDKYDQVLAFEKNPEYIMDEELRNQLAFGGFLIEDEVDELVLFRHDMLKARYSSHHLGLTIAPTSDCNFECVYCYEKDNMSCKYMSQITQDKVVDVKSHISHVTDISISWYGGEPLLAIDIIEKISKRIIAIADKYKINYSAGIITNGYLLTKENAERLKKVRISACQVTIDGLSFIHDQRRPLRGGKPTFDTIMKNLKAVKGIMSHIALRVNVDKDNINAIDQMAKYLEDNGMSDSITPYPAAIRNSNNCYQNGSCLQLSEYFDLEFNFLWKMSKTNKNIKHMLMSKVPARKSSYCCADVISSYVVDADGLLYKCWSDIGKQEISFGIIGSSNLDVMKKIRYLQTDPTECHECRACRYLPICAGGCPSEAINRNIDRCNLFKQNVLQYLQAVCSTVLHDRRIEAGGECEG